MKRTLAAVLSLLMAALLLSGCAKKDVEYMVLDEALSDEQYAIGFKLDNEELIIVRQGDILAIVE